jgi:hypothetical protein
MGLRSHPAAKRTSFVESKEIMMVTRSIAWALFALVALVAAIGGSVAAQGTPEPTEPIPSNLTPPSASVRLFELHAIGDQIYTCEADPDTAGDYIWTFKAPEAELFNSRGELVGTHFAGPSWQGLDGSMVVGEVLERADSPNAGSIPWLLLGAKERSGSGAFSTVTYVQRLDTIGGAAPVDGCDESHQGDEIRVPYEANYAFFFPVAVGATPVASVATT